jgi:hypothetical protein
VLSSQNFACHFDDNTEDILDSRLWENILDRKRSFENLLRDIKDESPHDGISEQVLSVLHQNKF